MTIRHTCIVMQGDARVRAEEEFARAAVESKSFATVESASKLFDMTPAQFGDSLVRLVERVTYVFYFGQTMEMVPAHIAYEHGRLWREAVGRALVPRLLDPSKAVIDDSERTSYYTGNRVAGAEEGASISLGYLAESYIDFGPVGMMGPLFLWGLFAGWVYRVLIRSTRYPIFGYGCGAVLIGLGASALEQSNLKMVSAAVLGFVVLYLFQKLFVRRLLGLLAQPGITTATRGVT